MHVLNRTFLTVLFLLFTSLPSVADEHMVLSLIHPVLVSKFYAANNHQLVWFASSPSADSMRKLLLQMIDSSACIGSERSKYHFGQLQEIADKRIVDTDGSILMNEDMLFTDAAIAYCKDLYQGSDISEWMMYDEWSKKFADKDDDFIVSHLAALSTETALIDFVHSLEPPASEYQAYQRELNLQYALKNVAKAKRVAVAMNFYRWISHFHFEQFIVVNIGSATLRYFEQGSETLFSKMIVGKPSTRTPRFDATCRQVILYPYWNVPQDITLRELLPKYKKKPALVDAENMQVLDKKGNIVSPYSVKWSQYNSRNFPYRFRQSTGCDNSLGVIKFDLTSPFDVYLHDTNAKGLFRKDRRYRSHGCMRVEKAIELGNHLLKNRLDTSFLLACMKDEKPIAIQLEQPVPVFVVYMLAEPGDNGAVMYYDDVYRLYH